MRRTLKTTNHIVHDCHYHVVWCTKYRLSLLTDGADEDLKKIATQVSEEFDAEVEEMEVMPDRIHILLNCYPPYAHKIIRTIKGRSSKALREKYSFIKSRTPSLWTRSYFISTTGGASLNKIQKYIQTQKLRESQNPNSSPRLKPGASLEDLGEG